MRLAFLFFFFSAVFYSPVLLAQTDSTFTDTVVIIKDPHVIRHEVVIRSPSEAVRKIPPMKFGLYYGIGNNKIKSDEPLIEVKGKSFQNFGIRIGWSFRKLEISTGAGILTTTINHNTLKSFETVRYQKENVILTTNTITITDSNGVTTTRTDTKSIIVTREVHETVYYSEKNSFDKIFIQIPVFIGYIFQLPYKGLKITPGIQLIMNKTLNGSEANKFNLKNTFWFYGCHLKFEYPFNNYISAELKGFWQQCQGNIYKEKHVEVWKLTGISFGINYLIGNY